MLNDVITAGGRVQGRARLYAVVPGFPRLFGDDANLPPGWVPASRWKPNLVLASWATVAARLLAGLTTGFKLGWMYVEYENVADEGDEVETPEYGVDPEFGPAYYASLASHPSRDYLRVPVIAATVDVEDAEAYPDGNLARFFAETVGAVGVHGKAFSNAARSKVFGAALVAGGSDPADDLVFSRYYVAADEQTVKPDNGPVGIQWKLTLRV